MARLLIIDDDVSLRGLVVTMAEAEGWESAEAATGSDGLALAAHWDPDVIVLDLGLPDLPGFEVLAELKADPVTRWRPVVVLSAADELDAEVAALTAGAQDMLTKPVPLPLLMPRLEAAARVAEGHREARATSAELQQAMERFRLTFEEAPIGMALVGLDGQWQQVNQALCRILGYTPEELLRHTFQDLTHPEDLAADLDLVSQLVASEIEHFEIAKRYRHRDGRWLWAQLNVCLVRDEQGEPLHFIGQIQDITAQRAHTAVLQARAVTDTLTGLPNRRAVTDAITSLMDERRLTSVLFVDLDGFKAVNDHHGHDVGDATLTAIAERLRSSVRPHDIVGRLGGDELVVVCPDTNEAAAEGLRRRLAEELSQPISAADRTLDLSASVGAATSLPGENGGELMRRADSAMYRHKRQGRRLSRE